ncbi:MAG: pilus assembly protein PilM [Syntrophomonadaceae bacterium]|nr:pilus assembly protein PilM [Syntrophomonadaceae bacterium]
MENKRIFALDIGTRKIIGLLMQKTEAGYEILASEMIEHSTRAMMDGQIHDVEAVAATILAIKNKLEEQLETKLETAAVAAAGRALKTAVGIIRKKRTLLDEISGDEVRALEIEAVHQAQYLLGQEEINSKDRSNYFCVGYSVISYQVEDQEIVNLVGQVGSEIGVKLIATFLPRVVVDSLFSSLKRVGLDIFSLTLEPIAALAITIPPSMRLLNLALVDIGAGTSDIAVVKNGNIFAYAMVPMGGDRLTELLAGHYLLDFNHAESIKRQLSDQDEVEIKDVLGNQSVLASAELIQDLHPGIEQLVDEISRNILELNQKTPDAVICVGGGSMTPTLTAILADKLALPKNRVGIKTPESFENLKISADYLKGPQGVTPLGIAYYSFAKMPVPFIKVSVNGREIALWNMGEVNISTALLSSGSSLANIYGKPGPGKTIEVNGEVKAFKGEMGTPPIIKLNGHDASLDTTVQEGDSLEFVPGQNGKAAAVYVKDLLPEASGHVLVNGEHIDLRAVAFVNGKESSIDDEIPDRARVEFKAFNNPVNILKLVGISEHWLVEKNYCYYLNEEEKYLPWTAIKVWVNGKPANFEDNIEFGSEVSYTLSQLRPRVKDLLKDPEALRMNVSVNGEKVGLEGKGAIIRMDGKVVGLEAEVEDGARIILDQSESNAMLSDIFKVVEMEPGLNARLKIKVDGATAGFTTPIYNHSKIELLWEE